MKKTVKDCTLEELKDSGYHFICYPDPYKPYIAVSKDGKKYYDYEEEIEVSKSKLLPRIKGYCKDCYFIQKTTYGLRCYKNTGYERFCEDDDYCSDFEPREEKENERQESTGDNR